MTTRAISLLFAVASAAAYAFTHVESAACYASRYPELHERFCLNDICDTRALHDHFGDDLGRGAAVHLDDKVATTGASRFGEELRGAGCAGVVIDFDPRSSLCGPEGVLRPLLSKRSSAFGSLGLSLGMGMPPA